MHRDIPKNASEVESISAAKVWLTRGHMHISRGSPAISHGSIDLQLPTRLIDVNLSNTSLQPFLHVSYNEEVHHTALSYC
jgi:hypothetical protein